MPRLPLINRIKATEILDGDIIDNEIHIMKN